MSIAPLLRKLEDALTQRELDAASIAGAARAVLEYLADAQRSTPEDMIATARCMTSCLFLDEAQCQKVEALPESLASVILDMATFLDDMPTAPDIARNFDSDVDDLLRRLRRYDEGGEL